MRPGTRQRLSHPVLAVILALLLALLLVGAMAPVKTTGGRTECAVMAGIVTGDAADHGALQAALGFGASDQAGERNGDKQCSDNSHDDHSLVDSGQHVLY
jgi:hypothetical protein